MKLFQRLTLSIITACGLMTVAAAPVGAIDVFGGCSGGNSNTSVCEAQNSDNASTLVKNIVSTLLWVIAAVAGIVIVVGGIKYVTSNGDANKIQSAKNTIMYAVIGLVVAIVAQAIVMFVVNWLV
jgi:heme/copper-type cytochrome/quinol oxidase subunit 2